MIDTHAHIYLPEFDADRDVMLNTAFAAGVQRVLLPAIDSSTHEAMMAVEEAFDACVSMMGLHPCSVKENYRDELGIIREYLKKRRFIAIGEIGLDFYWDKTFMGQQYEAFHEQVKIALEYDLPIVIHSRNATDECIEVIKQHKGSKGVFHCFSGNTEQAQKIIDAGYLLGIGGVVTFKNAGLDKVLEEIGLEHIVLETDAPYLAPVPYRGKRNESAYIKYVAEKLSAITHRPVEEVIEITMRNTQKLFKL